MRKVVMTVCLLGLLAGCGSREGDMLKDFGRSMRPGEQTVVTFRPLEIPTGVFRLPPPTPGGTNRADLN